MNYTETKKANELLQRQVDELKIKLIEKEFEIKRQREMVSKTKIKCKQKLKAKDEIIEQLDYDIDYKGGMMKIEANIIGLENLNNTVFDTKTWNNIKHRTLKRAGTKFKTKVVKDVRKVYNIKSKEVKKKMKSTINDGVFKIEIKSNLLSLTHFGARQTKKGVSVLIRRGKRKILANSFIAKGQVFQRKTKERLPLSVKKTISITQMFNPDIVKESLAEIQEFYPLEFERNINYYLKKMN